MRILLIEDEKKVSDFIKQGLEEEAYIVEQAFDGQSGEWLAFESEFNLIILDLMLPKVDGMTLCQRLRDAGLTTPILMLTAKGETQDRVAGLNQGADDYLVKPFEFDELLARIRALLRRQSPQKQTRYQVGDLVLNTLSHEVSRAGQKIDLTLQEYRLLEYLMLNQGLALSRQALAESVWEDPDIAPGTIDVYINYLRKKIDRPFASALIQTVRGIGYMLTA